MNLGVEWSSPIKLKDAASDNLIYKLDLERMPRAAGVYVFGRKWGNQFEALYVGKAGKIRGRIKTQLNNLRLMQHLKNAKAGKRVVMIGQFMGKPGQQVNRCLPLIERTLIRYFLSEGHDLVNVQGTRLRRHEVSSDGRHPRNFIPKLMYVE